MSKSRSKPKRNGRPRTMGPITPKPGIPLSLPPAGTKMAVAPPPSLLESDDNRRAREKEETEAEARRRGWYLPPDSKLRRVCVLIAAARIAGIEDVEIAKQLGISPKSISPYMWRANKNGWLSPDSPRERLEMVLAQKAVDNLEAMLGDERPLADKRIKHEATENLLKGTLYKTFDKQEVVQALQQTVVAVRVEMPDGPRQVMREDTTGGMPAHCKEGAVL